MTEIGQHPVTTTDNHFRNFGLSESTLKLLEEIKFHHPTPIQSELIPVALTGRDLIGLAQTGSGKTAAFVLPIAEKLQHGKGLRGLILAPTREIALQTKAFLDLFGKHHRLKTICLIGGVGIGSQISGLKKNPDIAVATPGRLNDHLQRGTVRLNNVEILILDEADHMLDLGFLPQIHAIIRKLPADRHTMMFSATMPSSIENLARQYLKNPHRIDILPKGRAAEGITHRLYLVDQENKKKCLLKLLHHELGSTLVFSRRRVDANWIYHILEKEKHPVSIIHSDRSQSQRTQALQSFKEGHHRILVATDIASRGIDVPGLEHIVNYNVPDTVEEYIHRSGRTARAGAQGLVSTIATWQDKQMIQKIEQALGKEVPRCTLADVPAYIERPVKSAGRNRRGQSRPRRWSR